MDDHASPAPDDRPGRPGRAVRPVRRGRWLAAATAILGGAGLVTTVVHAGARVDGAATVTARAERIVATLGPGLRFPMEPLPRCDVLNNFGGLSRAGIGGGHQGVDIGAELGQEVYAVEDGELYRQWTDLDEAPGLGWGLWAPGSDTKYRYFHLSRFAEGLEVGDRVVAGQLIGYVGDTGNATPGGWHLHFEVHPGPEPHERVVDPVPLLAIPTTCRVS